MASELISVSIPANFLSLRSKSLGQRMSARSPVVSRTPSWTATPAIRESQSTSPGDIGGRSRKEQYIPVPGSECQEWPPPPLAAVCSAAKNTAPPGALPAGLPDHAAAASASDLVDSAG